MPDCLHVRNERLHLYDDPNDPEAVTGYGWIDGYYEENWEWSDWAIVDSETLTFLIDSAAPSVPSALQATAITNTSFTLSWSAATDNVGVAAYEVRRDGVSLGTTTTLSWAVSGLFSGVSSLMEVRAKDALGNASGWVPLTVSTNVQAAAVGLTASNVGPYGVTLSWLGTADASGVAGYKLYRSGVGVAVATTSDLAFTDTGLTAGVPYTYSLRRVNFAGTESAVIATVNVTTDSSTVGHSDVDGIPDSVEAALGTSATSVASSNDGGLLQPKVHRPNQ